MPASRARPPTGKSDGVAAPWAPGGGVAAHHNPFLQIQVHVTASPHVRMPVPHAGRPTGKSDGVAALWCIGENYYELRCAIGSRTAAAVAWLPGPGLLLCRGELLRVQVR
eukprot:1161446-Pelagomonas_calceolata.AAC.17